MPAHGEGKEQVEGLGLDSIISGAPSKGFRPGSEMIWSVFQKGSVGYSGEGTLFTWVSKIAPTQAPPSDSNTSISDGS